MLLCGDLDGKYITDGLNAGKMLSTDGMATALRRHRKESFMSFIEVKAVESRFEGSAKAAVPRPLGGKARI
ncbi:hypothetical protein AWB85_11135 [Mycobacteroides immunogenum]|uniref:Uncharacterized protein n=1 Tax=Mycobacteroides immunogenum TaxID=83262 RepID=A0A179VBK7_9MYCO|nr:hypothetical protein AWB85_11135 [Mycobacteroides immunogenum]